MSAVYLHLISNHFPVIGTITAFFLLGAAWLFKSEVVKKVAFGVTLFAALLSIPPYYSGHEAEEAVEDLPGVTEPLIEEHEEIAEKAFVSILVTGGLALLALLFSIKTGKTPAILTGLMALSLVVSMTLMGLTANRGGKIRHTEIRDGATSSAPAEPEDD